MIREVPSVSQQHLYSELLLSDPRMLEFHKQGMFSPAAGSRSPFSHSQITQKHNYSSAYFNYDKRTDWYD